MYCYFSGGSELKGEVTYDKDEELAIITFPEDLKVRSFSVLHERYSRL